MSQKLVPIGKLLNDACVSALDEIGFKKKKAGIFYKKYGNDLYLRLGLNESKKSIDTVEINPIFGVGWEKLESLLTECNRGKYSRYLYASFSSNIGGFEDANNVVKATFNRDSLVNDIESFKRYLNSVSIRTEERYANYSDLISGLLKFESVRQQEEKLACYYFLIGDVSMALSILEKKRKSLDLVHPALKKEFSDFSEEFLARINCNSNDR